SVERPDRRALGAQGRMAELEHRRRKDRAPRGDHATHCRLAAPMNFWDLLAVAHRRDPAAPALQLADGRTYTHDELHAAAERWAAALHARGVEAGERIALWLGNREETVLAYLAALRLGAVAVPLNLAYRRGELAHVLADAQPRLLLTDREQLTILDEIGRDVLGSVPLGLVEELAIEVEAGRGRPLPLEGQGDGGIGVEQDP